jgi:hypothetical protein
MKRLVFIFICLLPVVTTTAQNAQYLRNLPNIKFLDSVPKDFESRYMQQKHDFNPLHVGDIWQYDFGEGNSRYGSIITVQDSIINGKRYFKRINFGPKVFPRLSHYNTWERNDSLKDNSYMLDFEDLDQDGDTLEELPIDSLELPDHSYYKTYKILPAIGPEGERDVFINYSDWAVIWGDTVKVRTVEYLSDWLTEYIADKYGVIALQGEASQPDGLSGAIIDGITYGTIVSVENEPNPSVLNFTLENNYPNPFNPSTKIGFKIAKSGFTTLKVYDILGREVATLVNYELIPGNYEKTFDGTGLASGVYMYRLQVSHIDGGKETYIQTRKLLFQK